MSQAIDSTAITADTEHHSGEFSLSEARRIVGEYFTPNPWIYWPDFLVSWIVAMASFQVVDFPELITTNVAWHWPVRIVAFVISSLLIYRCSLFIHELVHIRAGEFTAFRFVWNLLCGIPFLIPTFVYYTHLDHHRRKHYGTKEDGEYIPLARLPAWQILFYLSQIFVIPVVAVFRFGVLTPLTWISPTLRKWVHRHASSMIMDPTYIRPLPTNKTLRTIRFQEVLVFLFIWLVAVRMVWAGGLLFEETLPPSFLLHAYLTGVFVLAINALRTLGAHRWTHLGEHEMTFVEQMLDSVNYPKHPFTGGLWAPIGLRYHALHHIFPTMPYHALAEAHRRLIRDLPADSPYRHCQAESLHEVLGTLWRRARENDNVSAEPNLELGA
ncbi:fatty acid desaturase family protein [Bythopirellula goksoeyrii]|uniref:Fatty acid desaturase n=1 Tax=Bythopirellula goksoeyrii TaxID=1400387 RepID=A0A5B9QHA2_9BACT|nr:fatty acid desaturase [Bythopirellula goksoeyrii]QEG33563.1 Fatty acid desaturase [Bythopirellula goksoeyrii]